MSKIGKTNGEKNKQMLKKGEKVKKSLISQKNVEK